MIFNNLLFISSSVIWSVLFTHKWHSRGSLFLDDSKHFSFESVPIDNCICKDTRINSSAWVCQAEMVVAGCQNIFFSLFPSLLECSWLSPACDITNHLRGNLKNMNSLYPILSFFDKFYDYVILFSQDTTRSKRAHRHDDVVAVEVTLNIMQQCL